MSFQPSAGAAAARDFSALHGRNVLLLGVIVSASACSSSPLSGAGDKSETTSDELIGNPIPIGPSACGAQGHLCCAGDAYHQCDAQTTPITNRIGPGELLCQCGSSCGAAGHLACSTTNNQVDREQCKSGLMPVFNLATKEGGTCISCNDYSVDIAPVGSTSTSLKFNVQVSPPTPF